MGKRFFLFWFFLVYFVFLKNGSNDFEFILKVQILEILQLLAYDTLL